MKAQRITSATRCWEYFSKDYLWTVTVFTGVVLWNYRLIQKRWVPKSFFFEKPNKTMSFYRNAFQSTLLKHAGKVFFVLRNADFFKLKNASELSWLRKSFVHKSFTQRANNASWLISYFDMAYCYRPVVPNRWVAEEFLWGREQQPQ